jgi:hypothetical protein
MTEEPARPWGGTWYAALAILLGIAAMPLAIVYSNLAGASVAALGLLVGLFAALVAITRRWAGIGVSLAGMAICGSILFATAYLLSKDAAQDQGRTQATPAKQVRADATAPNRDLNEKRPPARDPRAEPQEKPPRVPGSRPDPAEVGGEKIARLLRELKSDRSADRVRAAERLGKLGAEARPAARGLCEAALDEDDLVRVAALDAIHNVSPRLHQPVFTILVNRDSDHWSRAAKEIGALGPDGSAATPILVAHLDRLTGRAPSNIFPKEAVVLFSSDVLDADMTALANIAGDESIVWEEIVYLTTYRAVSARAVKALGRIARLHPAKQTASIKALSDAAGLGSEESAVCLAAIDVLVSLGSDAKDAVPTLKKLKLDPNEGIRKAAIAALERIDR